jgi:glycosyltransferase involved in cell wall biosynthesis
MKLAVVAPAFPLRGGIVQFTANFVRALRARHDVELISFTRLYPGALFPGRTQEDHAGASDVPNTPLIDALDPRTWRRTANRLRATGVEGVLFMYWTPFFAPCFSMIAELSRVPAYYCCHNALPHEPMPGMRLVSRLLYRRARGVLVLSKNVETQVRALAPNTPIERTTHPAPVEMGAKIDRRLARETLGLDADERVLLFFGLVRAYKGLDTLFAALPRLRSREKYRLLVAGELYVKRELYQTQLKALGGRVRLEDRWIPDAEVATYFSAADLAVLPYRSASQSGVLPLSRHFELPVVATSAGGLAETIEDGVEGFIVPPDDPLALATAIDRYFDEDLFAPMRTALREQNHSWDAVARAFEALTAR